MSATRKIEITEQTNQNWMDRTIENLAPYRRAILGFGLALVVGMIAISLISRQREQKTARAWDSYFSISEITSANEEAVRKMITELGSTEPGQMLRLKFSQYLLREGTQQLFSDKTAGKKKIDEAQLGFTSIAAASKNTLAIEEALLGVAMSEAALGNIEPAINAYEAQLKKFPQGLFSKVAATNLERLKSPASNEWYKWFQVADVAAKTNNNPFSDFNNRPRGSGFPGSVIPSNGPLPSLEGPGSLLPSLDPLNPLGSGVPSTTPGLPSFSIPGPTTTDPGTKDPATTPEKTATDPAATTEGKSPTGTPPEKAATPEPAKTEPSKDAPASKEPEPAAKK